MTSRPKEHGEAVRAVAVGPARLVPTLPPGNHPGAQPPGPRLSSVFTQAHLGRLPRQLWPEQQCRLELPEAFHSTPTDIAVATPGPARLSSRRPVGANAGAIKDRGTAADCDKAALPRPETVGRRPPRRFCLHNLCHACSKRGRGSLLRASPLVDEQRTVTAAAKEGGSRSPFDRRRARCSYREAIACAALQAPR